jgi:hypothetical protein
MTSIFPKQAIITQRSAEGAKYSSQGKRRAKRGASPLGKRKIGVKALKERNKRRWYFALSVLA